MTELRYIITKPDLRAALDKMMAVPHVLERDEIVAALLHGAKILVDSSDPAEAMLAASEKINDYCRDSEIASLPEKSIMRILQDILLMAAQELEFDSLENLPWTKRVLDFAMIVLEDEAPMAHLV